MNKLRTGVAYHGNRILKHVEADMVDIVNHNMNTVVHMFSHNDWDRHLGVMKDIVKMSEDLGLEVWIDNWGLGGAPGDRSHFLQYHPESHQIYSDGSINPIQSCYNSPAFIEFTKSWMDTVKEFGGKKIFWDEPHLPEKEKDGKTIFSCCCPKCKALFEERYNKAMPTEKTPEVIEFRSWTVSNYFATVTAYAASIGLESSCCIMPHSKETSYAIMNVKNISDFGLDPYWHPESTDRDPYGFVYNETKELIDLTTKAGKDNHVWIQGFSLPSGCEDQIITAVDAAYDAGARTILSWSYRGAESNTYKCDNCDLVWQITGEAMHRIRDRYFDEVRNEKRKQFGLK